MTSTSGTVPDVPGHLAPMKYIYSVHVHVSYLHTMSSNNIPCISIHAHVHTHTCKLTAFTWYNKVL